ATKLRPMPNLGVNSGHERPCQRSPARRQARRRRRPGQGSVRRARGEDLHQPCRPGLRHALGHRAEEARPQGARRLLLQARRCFRAGEQRDAAPARRDRGAQQGVGEARRNRHVEHVQARRQVLTFVLVHGAWGGSWMWQRVAHILRAAGHDVFTPSLTGLGERAHLASPAVDLSMHIADVLGTLACERLSEVVLVGHSYGGMVVTGVADRAAERVRTLVYLDAFVPQPGQALLDLVPPRVRDAMPAEGWQAPPLPPQAPGMTDPAERAWLEG